jgi:hypothetical protein
MDEVERQALLANTGECHLSDKKDCLPRKVPRYQAPLAAAFVTITWRSLFTKTISAG